MAVLADKLYFFSWDAGVRDLMLIEFDKGPQCSRPVSMSSDLQQRDLLVFCSNGAVHRMNLFTLSVEKEVVRQIGVDPRCVDSDSNLKWIVSRGFKKAKNKVVHFLNVLCKWDQIDEKVRKSRKLVNPQNWNGYFLVKRVQTYCAIKKLRLISKGDRMVMCGADNALMMMDLGQKDFDPNSVFMRGRGSVTCMELSLDQGSLFLGTSLRMVEKFKIENLRISKDKRYRVNIAPTALALSSERNRMIVGTQGNQLSQIHDLEKMGVESDDSTSLAKLREEADEDWAEKEEDEEADEDEEDLFDDDEILALKRTFRERNCNTVLENLRETNIELLNFQNAEDREYIISRAIEKKSRIKGLNNQGERVSACVLRINEILTEACGLLYMLFQGMLQVQSDQHLNQMNMFGLSIDIYIISVREKLKLANKQIEELYEGNYDGESGLMQFEFDPKLLQKEMQKLFEDLKKQFEAKEGFKMNFKVVDFMRKNMMGALKKREAQMERVRRNQIREAMARRNQQNANQEGANNEQ